jgi:hypothetical protein
MVSSLHTVEVKQLASGMQYPFGKGKKFSLIQDGIFFGRQGRVVDGGTIKKNGYFVHLLQHEISEPKTVPENFWVVATGYQADIHELSPL